MTRGASRGWFRAGALGLIVVAAMHTMGHFSGGPRDSSGVALEAAMKAYRIEMMGMNPSASGITNSLSLTMSVLLALTGLLDLAILSIADPVSLRRFAVLNVAGVSALVALFTYYHVPPPLVTLAIVGIFFITSLLGAPRYTE
jgi:hypothetical protein